MILRALRLTSAAIDIFRREGATELLRRTNKKLRKTLLGLGYDRWIRENEPYRLASVEIHEDDPLISILMPVYNVEEQWLQLAIESVRAQTYPHWELCIADDASTLPGIRPLLEVAQRSDARIKVIFRERNGHISEASNSALSLATGEWLALLDHDDELAPFALEQLIRKVRANPTLKLIYSDEDKITESGKRYDPYFKPEWNPDLFYSQNYLNHLTAYRTDLVLRAGGFQKGFEGAQDYDLALRVLEGLAPEEIGHIPHVLYHWRSIPNSVALAPNQKDYAGSAARKALASHFERLGIEVSIHSGPSGWHRVQYALPESLPSVSLIICTKDRISLLKQIVDGIYYDTDYAPIQLVIVDHESQEPETLAYFDDIKQRDRPGLTLKLLRYTGSFNFSAMNNFAVQQSTGTIVGLLNNDLKIIHKEWLKEMVAHALRPEVGAVGARLYYEDGRLQHAGVILGVGGVAGHAHRFFSRSAAGYFGRAQLIQDFSAVTAACILLRRDVFSKVGGLDEEYLPVAFNDIDLCLKVRQAGLRVLYTPHAELYHLESATRGSDNAPENNPRFKRELDLMKARWGETLLNDPCYSPNLTLDSEDFSLGFPGRAPLR